MRNTSFEKFIRFGGSATITLKASYRHGLEVKQEVPGAGDIVGNWVEAVWSRVYGATAQAILLFRPPKKPEDAEPHEFSAAGLSKIDQDALREQATEVVRAAMAREGIEFANDAWEQRALAVLTGFLNQAQQKAMGIEFYVWQTQNDPRVRGSHAEREGKIFRWDTPPEGGHPTQDFGCRCYARPLGIEGYWDKVSDGVDIVIADLAESEGNIDHMYLDTRSKVTVGQGTLLETVGEAVELPFLFRSSRSPATEDDIRAEYEILDAMVNSEGNSAEYYEQFTLLVLGQATIEALVREYLRENFVGLLKIFPGFGNFPVSAQVAIWDMVYNLGLGGFKEKFPKLQDAVRAGDWATAAEESERSGIGQDRNDYVYDLFTEAANEP